MSFLHSPPVVVAPAVPFVVEVPRHLDPGVDVPALGVEGHVVRPAVEDGLVAADLAGEAGQGVDDGLAELPLLVGWQDRDLLDVAYRAAVVDALTMTIVSAGTNKLRKYVRVEGSRQEEEKKRGQHTTSSRR